MRVVAWTWALGATWIAGCALGFGYDDYERAGSPQPDGGGDGGTGVGGGAFGGGVGASGGTATGGVAGTSAGGVSGAAGSTGGSGASPGCTSDIGCPEDSECANWFCENTQCKATLTPTGTPCGAAATCVGGEFSGSSCQGTVCAAERTTCSPNQCTTAGCCALCNGKLAQPSLGDPFCPPDSQAKWTTLTNCCANACKSSCIDTQGDPLLVCDGPSTAAVPMVCTSCLNTSCLIQMQACAVDAL